MLIFAILNVFHTKQSHVFLLLIDRAMCIIRNNQTLDVLIKYIAKYHNLYSGQLEIRLSVFIY